MVKKLVQFKTFGKVDRSPVMRMVAVGFIGIIDSKRVNLLRETKNTSNADWFPIDKIPPLGYDHEEILHDAIIELRKQIIKSNIINDIIIGIRRYLSCICRRISIVNQLLYCCGFSKSIIENNIICAINRGNIKCSFCTRTF